MDVDLDTDSGPNARLRRASVQYVEAILERKFDNPPLFLLDIVEIKPLTSEDPTGDLRRRKLARTIDGLAIRNADLQEQLKLMTQNRATALNLVEEQRQALRKLPELEEALRVEQEAHKRTERRLGARERELERIRTTMYKDRVEEFVKITTGEEK